MNEQKNKALNEIRKSIQDKKIEFNKKNYWKKSK